MSWMIFAELYDLALAAPQAATALAIGAHAVVASAVGLGQIAVILHGIAKMSEADEAWAATHRELMEVEAKRHEQSMTALRRLIRKPAPRGW